MPLGKPGCDPCHDSHDTVRQLAGVWRQHGGRQHNLCLFVKTAHKCFVFLVTHPPLTRSALCLSACLPVYPGINKVRM